jgi:hypothetical protein
MVTVGAVERSEVAKNGDRNGVGVEANDAVLIEKRFRGIGGRSRNK